MLPIDTLLFDYLHRLVDSGWAQGPVIFLASYLGWILLTGFVVYELIQSARGFRGVWSRLLFVVVSAVCAWTLAEAGQFFLVSPRPFAVLEGVRQLVAAGGNSFPSGHAAFFFALGYAIAKYHRRLGAAYIAGAILIGLARIAAGIHWPSDVLAGFILGALVAGLVNFLLKSRYNYPRD